MQNPNLSGEQLQALCNVLADTSRGLTKTQLSQLLRMCGVTLLDDGSYNDGLTYKIGLNKSKWLFNCLASDIDSSDSSSKTFLLVQKALNPISFTRDEKREQYEFLLEGVNKVLSFIGLTVTRAGTIAEVPTVKTLKEVDQRVNGLRAKLYHRAIHQEVQKYCINDYLRKDYYDAVFEAAKSLAERVRQLTGLNLDGSNLFQSAFSTKHPLVFINTLKDESERSEFLGLRELLEAIHHLVRNPVAHKPKLNWATDETKALDILTVISFAHKYLDICYLIPTSQKNGNLQHH